MMTVQANTMTISIPNAEFETNVALDVSNLVKKYPKGGMEYLPWSVCLMLMKRHYPKFSFTTELFDGKPVMFLPDGSAIVSVLIVDTISGATSLPSHFPVMTGFNHSSAIDPDSRAITDSIQRAKAKVLAEVTGIGLNLWLRLEEEDINGSSPVSTRETAKRAAPARRPAPSPVVEDEEYSDDDSGYDEEEDCEDEEEEVFETEEKKPLARRTQPARAASSTSRSSTATTNSRSQKPATTSKRANPFG